MKKYKWKKSELLLITAPLVLLAGFAGWKVMRQRSVEALQYNFYLPKSIIELKGNPTSLTYLNENAIAVSVRKSGWLARVPHEELHIFNIESGRSQHMVTKAITISNINFLPSSNLLAFHKRPYSVAGNTKSQIVFWNTKQSRVEQVLNAKSKDNWQDFTISSDGRTLAVTNKVGAEEEIQLRDIKTNSVKILKPFQRKSSADGNDGSLAFSPDGKTLAYAMNSFVFAEIKLYSVTTGRETQSFPVKFRSDHNARLAFSPNGKQLAFTGTNSGRLALINLSTKKQYTIECGNGTETLLFTPNEKNLIVSGYQGEEIQIINTTSRKTIKTITTNEHFERDAKGVRFGTPHCYPAIALSQGGKSLLSRGTNRFKVWDVSSLYNF